MLVLLRSGKEHVLIVGEPGLEELYAHPDIGTKRVFIMAMTEKECLPEIPWSKLFPGTKLYRTKAEMPEKDIRPTRSTMRIIKPQWGSAPVGAIEYYSGPLVPLTTNAMRGYNSLM